MTAADLFYYSAAIGIWAFILTLLFIVYRISQLISIAQKKIEQIQAVPRNTVLGVLSFLSNVINPRRGGGKYE